MKLIYVVSLASAAQAGWWGSRTDIRPRPMLGTYTYSTNSDNYLGQRDQDAYEQPNLGETYKINPLYDYDQKMLQSKEKLIYRHPALEKSPEYIPLNRVQEIKTYLPPKNSYGSSWSTNRPTTNTYANPKPTLTGSRKNWWQPTNRYNTYSNGLRRPQAASSSIYNSYNYNYKPEIIQQEPQVVPQAGETPQQQSVQLEFKIEESLAKCDEGFEYDFDFKRCVVTATNYDSNTNVVDNIDNTNMYNYRTASVSTTPIAPMMGVQKKGPKYYDYFEKSWKNCNYGESYNYKIRTCQPTAQNSGRWSFF